MIHRLRDLPSSYFKIIFLFDLTSFSSLVCTFFVVTYVWRSLGPESNFKENPNGRSVLRSVTIKVCEVFFYACMSVFSNRQVYLYHSPRFVISLFIHRQTCYILVI